MTLFRRTARTAVLGLVAGALAVSAAPPAQAAGFSEGFDSGTTPAGWQVVNLSAPVGDETWAQGEATQFPAQAGAPDSFFTATYRSGSGEATLSNWLITPPQTSLSSTDVFEFWTRAYAGSTYADRLEVRMSTNGSCNPGTTADGVGDFTTLLASVNPDLVDGSYPGEWTKYSLPLTGLADANVSGCVAFRYHVTNGGPAGDNSELIGIDSVAFTDNASTACTTATAAVAPAQAAVATATATLATQTQALADAKKALKKAKKKRKVAVKKAVKKAERTGDKAKVKKVRKKHKKKVRKAKKVVAQATTALAAATTGLTTAQATLTTAQGTVTSSCP